MCVLLLLVLSGLSLAGLAATAPGEILPALRMVAVLFPVAVVLALVCAAL